MEERFSCAVLTIECPDCGDRVKRTMRYLRTTPDLKCRGCASMLKVDSEQLNAIVGALEARLN
jgi:ribosomal protein S27E